MGQVLVSDHQYLFQIFSCQLDNKKNIELFIMDLATFSAANSRINKSDDVTNQLSNQQLIKLSTI